MYKNLYAYLAENAERSGDRFSVTINDASAKEPDMLHLMIHPESRDGITADFYLKPDGSETFATEM